MGSWLLSYTGKGSTCWRDLIIWKIFSVPKSYPKCKRPVVSLGVGISKTSGNSFLKWAVAEQEWKRWCRVSICPQNGQNWIEGSSWYCCHLDNWEPVAMEPVNRFTSMTVHPGEMFQEVCVFLSNQCGRSVGVLNVAWIVWQWFDGNLQSQIQDQPRSSSKMNTFRWLQEISPFGRMSNSNLSKNRIKIHTGPVPRTLLSLSDCILRFTQWFQTARRSSWEVELK